MSGRPPTSAAVKAPTPPARTDPGGGDGALSRRWLHRRWLLGEDDSEAGP
jgi:hypothetical protein